MSLSVWSSILFFFFYRILPHHHVPAGNSDENPNANPPRGAPAEKNTPTEHDLCGQGGWRWFKSWTSVESCCGKSWWQRWCWELSASLDTVNWEENWRWITPTILLQKAIGLVSPPDGILWMSSLALCHRRELIWTCSALDCQVKMPENRFAFVFLAIILSFASSKPFCFTLIINNK